MPEGRGLDLDEAREIVHATIVRMAELLRLDRWTFDVEYRKLADGQKGSCLADCRYFRAQIAIDPTEHDSREDLLRTLRHEMLHVFTSEHETYRQMVLKLVGYPTSSALDEAYDRAAEYTVCMVESVLDHLGHGLDAEFPEEVVA